MKRLRLRLQNERGFSLIELVFVMAILGVVMAGVTTVFISGSRAELSVNNRFQAQEASRLAMAAVRRDVHGACTGVVDSAKQSLTLSIPIGSSPVPPEQCGTVNATNIKKVIYIVCTSPTLSTRYALYVATDYTCSTASKVKLVGDNLVNTLAVKPVFASTLVSQVATTENLVGAGAITCTASCIKWGETESVDVDIQVSLKQGQSGQPFDLQERLALPNTEWSLTSGDPGQYCTPGTLCTRGPCLARDPVQLYPVPCYPALIR